MTSVRQGEAGVRPTAPDRPAVPRLGRATFGDAPRAIVMPRAVLLVLLVASQAILARATFLVPRLGLVQAMALLGLALYAALRRRADLALLVAAYLTGAELVWRQSSAPVPYQMGPYLMLLVAALSVILMYPAINDLGRRAMLYFALLLPSAMVTVSSTGPAARQLLAFSLAGPLAVAVLIVWFSQVGLSPAMYRRMLWTMAISGVGPLTIAATNLSDYLGTGEELVFSDASNFVASGGFGPVQVSSILGLTVLVCILLTMIETNLVARLLAGTVGVAAGVQSLLTFSRGGMFATGFAVAALVLAQTRSPQGRRRAALVIAVVFALGYFVIIPRVNNFTQGAFEERFTNTETGRTDLASSDLDVFERSPVFGVGPGMTKYQRLGFETCALRNDACRDEASSHTEFTRMMSEHGAIGILSMAILFSLAWSAVVRAGSSRFLALSFIVWSIAQMFYANIRIVAVAFAFAVAFIRVADDAPPEGEALADDDAAEPRPSAAGRPPGGLLGAPG